MTPVHVVGAVAVFVAFRGSLRTATAIVLGAVLLVPNNLTLGGFPPSLPLVRVVIVAFTVGLIVKVRNGDIPADALRPTRVHVAFVAFLTVALLNGVFLNPVDNVLRTAWTIWLTLADQLVVFAAILAAARLLGPWTVGRLAAGVAVATALVAAGEQFTGESYARWWFEQADRLRPGLVAAQELVERGDELRVRASSQFALEYAWVATMLLPLVAVVATRARRAAALAGPALLTLAIVWTVSRSAFVGIALGVLAALAASRLDKRILALCLAGAAVAGLTLLVTPSATDPFEAANPDSIASRSRRLTFVTQEVEDRPYLGLGLAGLRARGIRGTDSSYTLIYAATGVTGAVALGVLLVTTALAVAAGVRHRDPEERVIVAAALGGVVAGIASGVAMNSLTVAGSARTLWIMAAIGVAAAERADPPGAGAARWTTRAVAGRTLVPIAAAAVGVGVAALAPSHVAARYRFAAITPEAAAAIPSTGEFAGRVLINTVCDVAREVRTRGFASVECTDPRDAPALGELRVEARSVAALERAAGRVDAATRTAVPGLQTFEVEREAGTPTGLRTAPAWMGALGLAAAALVPRPRARPRANEEGIHRARGER